MALAELGLITKAEKGWALTDLGKAEGGKGFTDRFKHSFVLWPVEVLSNKDLGSFFNITNTKALTEVS